MRQIRRVIFQAQRDEAADAFFHSMRSQSDYIRYQEDLEDIASREYDASRRAERLASKFDAMESRRREFNWGE